ncbi:MAG: tRNA 2-thiouridine(34) synthase MnmA [Bacteroidetes bacterium]|nr:tRNA 2-thiouridine(34) synthase MnmA [Bacteroidota bacterium]MCB9227275.1 tRNA 2-thiouridine(34) synthase MnmA [Chitinophagales bacterium]
MTKKVVVGLSGGVDSSVAAYLLKQQGYDVIGIFMRNWVDDEVIISDECPWIEDSNDALLVADKLGIPFHVIDFSKEYKERIVNYMFDEYEKGRTPNPDILCNREVKFDLFLKKALALGADYVATGHYCQKTTTKDNNGKEIYHLIAGADKNKDQSYFLCQVSQEQLAKALFPIGHLQKSEVRTIATEQKLVTADKKDSQGLCFIGKVRLPDFLQQQLKPKEGNVIEIPENHADFIRNWENDTLENLAQNFIYNENDGKIVGKHQGAHYYTIGQRKGLNIGGTPLPLFVIATNTQTNTIYVGQGENHPGLYRKILKVANKDIHWLQENLTLKNGEEAKYSARIRYRQPLENCTLYQKEDGLYFVFDNFQRGIAAGQFVAWYKNDELIGSGVIG